MITTPLYIRWDVTPEIIEGLRAPNYYSLLFVTGLILGYFVIRRMFRKENIKDEVLDKLVMYVVVATIVGARLGHVFFYDWAYYKNHLNEIPQVWQGGLASHGGAIALAIALILFSKYVTKTPLLWIFDRIVAPTAIAAACIRLGNLMNSEIVGRVTDVPWAFEFVHYVNEYGLVDPSPRHPTQLYEAIVYLLLFGLLLYLFWKKEAWKTPGVLFGTFLVILFGARFVIEFWKEGQTAFDQTLTVNTGQWLSVPFILAGIAILVYAKQQAKKNLNA